MISTVKSLEGTLIKFGDGTLRLRPSKFGSQLEIISCKKTEIGEVPSSDKLIPGAQRIILEFTSVESLDVLLNKLNWIRSQMTEGDNGSD